MTQWSIARLALLATGLLMPGAVAPAEAAWSSFKSVGNDTVVATPSCAVDGAGTAVCAAVGTGSAPIVARYNGKAWSGWTHLSGVLTSRPACASVRTGQVICAARDQNLQMAAYLWNGTTWKGPLTPLSGLLSAPSCATLASGRVLCAARSAAGTLVSAVYGGSGWTASDWTTPKPLTDTLYSSVDCASDEAGDGICVYLSKTAATMARHFGTSWSSAVNIGGMASLPPICTDNGVPGEVGCFATGTNFNLYGQTFSGGSFVASHWSGYGSLGGLVNSFSCSQDTQNAGEVGYVCGVRGTIDDAFYTDIYANGSWAGYVSHGGSFVDGPACFVLNRAVTPGVVMCILVTGANEAESTTGP